MDKSKDETGILCKYCGMAGCETGCKSDEEEGGSDKEDFDDIQFKVDANGNLVRLRD